MADCELISVLDLLRQSRQKLILRTTTHSVDFFSNLFLFEKNEMGLKLLFEKEKTQFINTHFLFPEEDTSSIHSDFYNSAIKRLICLLSEEESSVHESISSSIFYKNLASTKIEFLDLLINMEEKSSLNLSQLKYLIIKDNRLFEREMERLTTGTKGDLNEYV
ncbi:MULTISPECIES: hypothetical protein [Rahnella]|jgi:hypothetical protein|uniref:hypothetical protein n=2 Tax=Yersiniaceae TaxID=1903411 RepID=UPI001AD850D9|nr:MULTISPECIES: hypothetical protein [Rahnella]MDF1893847.1 hypothetical protein [Rahnella contaminans]